MNCRWLVERMQIIDNRFSTKQVLKQVKFGKRLYSRTSKIETKLLLVAFSPLAARNRQKASSEISNQFVWLVPLGLRTEKSQCVVITTLFQARSFHWDRQPRGVLLDAWRRSNLGKSARSNSSQIESWRSVDRWHSQHSDLSFGGKVIFRLFTFFNRIKLSPALIIRIRVQTRVTRLRSNEFFDELVPV